MKKGLFTHKKMSAIYFRRGKKKTPGLQKVLRIIKSTIFFLIVSSMAAVNIYSQGTGQQLITVSGKVTDSYGESLPGVAVAVK